MTAELKNRLQEKLRRRGQEHLLRFWDDLSPERRSRLAEQIDSLDLDLVSRLLDSNDEIPVDTSALEPAGFTPLPSTPEEEARWDEARRRGEKAVGEGRVAAFVVAGGQGTRLGFDGPKGCFPIGPVTERTLFQIHAEKVLAAREKYSAAIPFLVMTSPANDSQTRRFLADREYFGLPAEEVFVFEQGTMPAADDSGRLILERPDHVFESPDGHGGSLKALWESGVLGRLEERGVEYISYFQVDNPLVRAVDPAFIGFHVGEGSEMSLKLLRRTIPDEKLGIWAREGGKRKVVEYVDMPDELMAAREEDGSLRFDGGSVGIHVVSVSFVRRLSEGGFRLPFHRARKKVPFVDEEGRTVEPDDPNAVKFETFVFDALELTDRISALETTRAEEFSPVKNASGTDSPETARRDLSELYARWLEAAGVEVPRDGRGHPLHPIEVSPLVATCAEDLKRNYDGPRRVEAPFVVAPG